MTEYERRVERTCYLKSIFSYQASLIKKLLADGYTISDISKITKISEKGVVKRMLGDENANIV